MIDRNIENRCKICRQIKPILEFRDSFRGRRGAMCISCEGVKNDPDNLYGPFAKNCGHCQIVKPYDQFPIDARDNTGRYTSCKSCCSKKCKESRARHPNAERFKKLRERYGLSPSDYLALPSYCGICKTEEGALFVDHNHSTGRVRALLCPKCNCGLGMFQESPEFLQAAIDYIHSHKESK